MSNSRAERLMKVGPTVKAGRCGSCCTEICPEQIRITDNAIIPLKERVVDDYYDPLLWLLRKLTQK